MQRMYLFLLHLPILLYSSKRMEGDEEQKLLLKSSHFQWGVTQLQMIVQVVIFGWPSVSLAVDLPRLFQVLERLCYPLHYKESIADFCVYEFNMKYLHFCCNKITLEEMIYCFYIYCLLYLKL